MQGKSVYAQEKESQDHTLRYIHIITKNVIWILNRIASLMRRKNYNMEEVSLSFDNENKAHFIISVDWELLDVQQVIHQINKLYDVYDVYDATHLKESFFNAYYVTVKDEKDFDNFNTKPISVIRQNWNIKWVFLLNLENSIRFNDKVKNKGFYYIKRLVSLI